ncbi:MAG: MmcQ/YjbR family DNA-binding protein [Proteobacteria bacterium]|nr:MmcQ/YjbR family DNA-binding protein [Pseudomonadota bacterium]
MGDKQIRELVGDEAEIRAFAMSFPEATEDFPWGDRAIRVRGKVFVFMGGGGGDEFGLSVKLPRSREFALDYPYTEPTGYGLGRHGWVSARFEAGAALPIDQLRAWITESFAAIAPKTLARKVGPTPPA